jgi:hypothetical protein
LEIDQREFSMSGYKDRKHTRYSAEPNELVTIYYLDESTKKTEQRVGLCQNESFKGCCGVFVDGVSFKQGQEVLCKCGKLPIVKAKVSWIKKLEDQITQVGFSIIT